MKIYIYPSGGQAKYIEWGLKFLQFDCEIVFVDDNSENSFDSLKEIIKEELQKGSKLFLSSPKYYDILLPKVKASGINECFCGVSVVANMLNSYFKEKTQNKQVIAVFLSGFEAKQKHLGSIVEILKDNSFCVVWIVSLFHQNFKEIISGFEANGEMYLCADCDILEKLDFFPFVIEQTNIVKFHTNVKSLKIVTSMEQLSNKIVSKKEMLEVQNIAYLMASYVNIHSQTFYDEVLKNQSFCGVLPNASYKLVKGGYPSIEKEVQSFGEVDFSIKRDTIIFISSQLNFDNPELVETLMIKCLQSGLRVLFKSCPPLKETCEQKEIEFANKFLKYDNFVFWDNSKPRLSKEELQRSITFVEVYSSLCYSYPCITKRPCILIYPKKDSIKKENLEQDIFYNPNLHIRIFLDDLSIFKEKVMWLASDIDLQKQWQEKIEKYCKEDLYNFGNASNYLANWIIQWYENREILKITL